jgi:hypothetical protein
MSDFNVGFVIFPRLTQLDFTGPCEVGKMALPARYRSRGNSDSPHPQLQLAPRGFAANRHPTASADRSPVWWI